MANVTLSDRAIAAIIGQALGDAREDAGLSQAAAARLIGIPQSTLSEIETGRIFVDIVTAVKILAAYGVDDLGALNIRGRDPAKVVRKRRRGRPRASDLAQFEFKAESRGFAAFDAVVADAHRLESAFGRRDARFEEAIWEASVVLEILSRRAQVSAEHRAAGLQLCAAARSWDDPETGELLAPFRLLSLARDILGGVLLPSQAFLH